MASSHLGDAAANLGASQMAEPGDNTPLLMDVGDAVDLITAWGSDTDADGKVSYYH